GIRDRNVTGVQTCALPISRVMGLELGGEREQQRLRPGTGGPEVHAEGQLDPLDRLAMQRHGDRGGAEHVPGAGPGGEDALSVERSEERRVGKGGRAWWGRR